MSKIIVDTNLLCLFIVGRVDTSYIAQHKRLRAFTISDYDKLVSILSLFSSIVTTPHILTETSNLLRHSPEPLRSEIGQAMARFVAQAEEEFSQAILLVAEPSYQRLGLADCAILIASKEETVVISDDLDLCLAGNNAGAKVINYNYFRDGAVSLSDIKELYAII